VYRNFGTQFCHFWWHDIIDGDVAFHFDELSRARGDLAQLSSLAPINASGLPLATMVQEGTQEWFECTCGIKIDILVESRMRHLCTAVLHAHKSAILCATSTSGTSHLGFESYNLANRQFKNLAYCLWPVLQKASSHHHG
jgi:hypothetical protein